MTLNSINDHGLCMGHDYMDGYPLEMLLDLALASPFWAYLICESNWAHGILFGPCMAN